MINVIQSAECYVDDRSEIKCIIHLKFKIYFYMCRELRSILLAVRDRCVVASSFSVDTSYVVHARWDGGERGPVGMW